MAKSKHFLEMDGLRGVAAISVALYHQQPFFGGEAFLGHGYLAVDFFFMLSGFVLVHAYGERLRLPGSFVPFVRDRIIRLYPMLIVGAGLGLIVALKGHEASLHTSVTSSAVASAINAMGLPDMSSEKPFWINPPTWSLFFELVANLIFAMVLFALTFRRLVALTCFLVLATLALDLHYGSLAFGWTRETIAPGLVRVCVSFFIGVMLHGMHQRGVFANGVKRWWVAPILIASFALVPTHSPLSILYDVDFD
ncbi:MAG: hypothetical protein JWO15_1696 [Sphingomonadales bacterium]|nr:hypothetical protein [Sphingomonadales bacterium]